MGRDASEVDGTPPPRVAAGSVAARLRAGEPLLLVCAYDSPVAWSRFGLAGALPLEALEARLGELRGGEEVVLYCRCPADRSAERAARRLRARGVGGVCVLAGGFEAAVAAGLRPLRRR